jgi:hypothetical protein
VGARLADFRIRPRTARSSDSANTTASRSWKKASPISQVSSRCSAVTDPASVVGTVAASSRMASKAGLDAIVLKLHRAFKSLIRGLVPQRQRRTRESSMCSVIRRPSLVRGGPPGDWCRVSAARRSQLGVVPPGDWCRVSAARSVSAEGHSAPGEISLLGDAAVRHAAVRHLALVTRRSSNAHAR